MPMNGPPASASTPPSPSPDASRAPARVGPDDPRYADLLRRGFNKRFSGRPDYVRLVHSTADVVEAVQDAVREQRRLVVRSGGHCLEGFVADPAVQVVIDTSLMTRVYYDPAMTAFAVEAGVTLGELARTLFLGWGVTLPAGVSPDVGVGGHVLGGAFGFLCRRYGLAADHLFGVELVVVDEQGVARRVVATRDAADPNRELWWAHTGGGGGNFGIVTRYWFRSPDAVGHDPARLLPRSPESARTIRVAWKWDDVDEPTFGRLIRNFGGWCERHGDAGAREAALYSMLFLRHQQYGQIEMIGLSIAGGDEGQRLIEEQLAAVMEGVDAPYTRRDEHSSWLTFALHPFPEMFSAGMNDARCKVKDAFLRRGFTDRQIAVAHDHLTRSGSVPLAGGGLGMVSYGGQVNTVASDATASPQRDSLLSTGASIGWGDPAHEEAALAWVRAFYRDLFGETGGVPVPGAHSDGAMINHPDADLADPAWNRSGVPWHTLYYKDNYPRLQQVKARWDPLNVFHHALSIRA